MAILKPTNPSTTESVTVLQLAHEYAQLFAEYRRRSDYRPYSVRHRFDQMSDSDVEQALDAARERLDSAPTVREQPAHDPAYLLAVIERYAVLEDRGELNEQQREYRSECRAALLRQSGGEGN